RPSVNEAIHFRDWFMVACLTMIPLRRRNFTALALGQHLMQQSSDWVVEIPGIETKTRRPYHARVPGTLVAYLEHYLAHVRPVLPGQRHEDALWIARGGRPINHHSTNLRITALTRQAFGTPLNLHAFRSLAASTLSIVAPDMMDGGRTQLGHATRHTTQRHYLRADAIQASRTHAQLIQHLRRRSKSGDAP